MSRQGGWDDHPPSLVTHSRNGKGLITCQFLVISKFSQQLVIAMHNIMTDFCTVQRKCGRSYDNTECLHLDRSVSKETGNRALIWTCSCKGSRCNSANNNINVSFSLFLLMAVYRILLL